MRVRSAPMPLVGLVLLSLAAASLFAAPPAAAQPLLSCAASNGSEAGASGDVAVCGPCLWPWPLAGACASALDVSEFVP